MTLVSGHFLIRPLWSQTPFIHQCIPVGHWLLRPSKGSSAEVGTHVGILGFGLGVER